MSEAPKNKPTARDDSKPDAKKLRELILEDERREKALLESAPKVHAPTNDNARRTVCGMRGLDARIARPEKDVVTCGVCRRMLALERRHAINPVTGNTECGRRPVLGLKTNIGGGLVSCAKCLRAIAPKANDRGAGR